MSREGLTPDEERALRGRLSGAVPDPGAAPERAARAVRAGRRRRLATVAATTAASAAVVAAVAVPVLGGDSGGNLEPIDGVTARTSTEPVPTEAEPTTRPEQGETEPAGPRGDRPPPVTIHYGSDSQDLEASSFCYGNLCVSGGPPDPPPSVGSPEQVLVDFPLEGWSFVAIFQPVGEKCGRMQTIELERNAQGSFVLQPAGYASTYDVTLFGRGNGDLATTFRWTTPFDGPLPAPEASLALVSGEPGDVTSYGVELIVSNLAETPQRASATVTVTAANRESLTFEAVRANGCRSEGTVVWDGPDDEGLTAAELGPAPFRYEVAVTLDGKQYVAHAEWPADEIKGNEPSVTLAFHPALPALAPR